MSRMIKTISLGAVPCCDGFQGIAPHGLKNFDDIIILDFQVTGVNSNNHDVTFIKLKSNNFQILIDDTFVKLSVSHNDTFFEVVYVTITYIRISMNNSFYGMLGTTRKEYLGINKVIFNKPATIVLWTDGSKTVVKVNKGERWDPEKGLAMAIVKKNYGLKQFLKYMEELK